MRRVYLDLRRHGEGRIELIIGMSLNDRRDYPGGVPL
jgi:hypothetical protein